MEITLGIPLWLIAIWLGLIYFKMPNDSKPKLDNNNRIRYRGKLYERVVFKHPKL